MSAATSPSYLVYRPSGYYFRIRVPHALQDRVGKTELRKSLASHTQKAAVLEAHRLAANAKDYFRSLSEALGNETSAVPQPDAAPSAIVLPTKIEPAEDTLRELIAAFEGEQISAGNWSLKTRQENGAIYSLLLRIIGNPSCSELSYPMLREYKITLLKLPANINKTPAYRGKPICQIEKMECIPMAINTINKHLNRVSSLLSWGVKHGYVSTNYAEGLQLKRMVRKDQERSPFSDEQLAKIFSQPLYTEGDYKYPYRYWLPLLGLYTGARLNELAQLYIADIVSSESIWLLSINADISDKKLKTLAAAREVPVHSDLVALGLIDYADLLRQNGHHRLFPELPPTRDGYGKTASKWFGRYRQSLELKATTHHSKAPDFHSFRHNVSARLRENGYGIEDIGELLGHSNQSTTSRYTKRLRNQRLSEMVESLNYPIRPARFCSM